VTKKKAMKKRDELQDEQRLGKDILDKHMKELSKSNGGIVPRLDLRDKMKILDDVAKNSPILILKVLNSSYGLSKGTQIKINCLGLLGSEDIVQTERKDGTVYFGHVQEDEIANTSIDYTIPVAKTTVEKSDQANM
jgi:hypothetical protein